MTPAHENGISWHVIVDTRWDAMKLRCPAMALLVFWGTAGALSGA